MAGEESAAQLYNALGRRAGFGRGRTVSLRNVPKDIAARFDAVDMRGLLRAERGRFGANGEVIRAMEAAHREMVISAGEFMVRAFDTAQKVEVGRPQNRPGYLRAAIRAPGNRISTPTGWGVGLPEHYDRSPARRYWRFIESGRTERGLRNPMEAVFAHGQVAATFWHPFTAAPGMAPYRSQGRVKWKYLNDTEGREGLLPPDVSTNASVVANRYGASLSAHGRGGDYIMREYPIIGTRRVVKIYFKKFKKSKALGKFNAFDGYDFHQLGADRFLAARQPDAVYRRYLEPLGVEMQS